MGLWDTIVVAFGILFYAALAAAALALLVTLVGGACEVIAGTVTTSWAVVRSRFSAFRDRQGLHSENRRIADRWLCAQEYLRDILRSAGQAPDFRRVVHAGASIARELPPHLKHSLFWEHRPLLAATLAERHAAGAEFASVANSLQELVILLGLPPFEAEYLIDQTLAGQTVPNGTAFSARIRALEAEHFDRLGTLQVLRNAKLQKELMEAEVNRFADAVRTVVLANEAYVA